MSIYKINYKITHDRQICVKADSEREAYEKAREDLELQDPFAIEIGDITQVKVKNPTGLFGFATEMRKCACGKNQSNIAEMNECKMNRGSE